MLGAPFLAKVKADTEPENKINNPFQQRTHFHSLPPARLSLSLHAESGCTKSTRCQGRIILLHFLALLPADTLATSLIKRPSPDCSNRGRKVTVSRNRFPESDPRDRSSPAATSLSLQHTLDTDPDILHSQRRQSDALEVCNHHYCSIETGSTFRRTFRSSPASLAKVVKVAGGSTSASIVRRFPFFSHVYHKRDVKSGEKRCGDSAVREMISNTSAVAYCPAASRTARDAVLLAHI